MNIKIKMHDRRILSLFRKWEKKRALRQNFISKNEENSEFSFIIDDALVKKVLFLILVTLYYKSSVHYSKNYLVLITKVQKEDDFNASEIVFCKTKTIFWPAKILYKWKKSDNDYLYQIVFYGSFKR
jgi:hypothetical protein